MAAITTRTPPTVPPRKRTRLDVVQALRTPKYWILVTVVVVIAYLSLVPMVFLAYETFTNREGQWSLENIATVLSDSLFGELMSATMVFTLGSTVIAMIIGTVLAYLHARTDIGFKSALFAVAIIPVIVPGLLFALSWVQLASPNTGILNLMLDQAFGVKPLNVYSMWGMVWIEGTNMAAVVFLLMVAGFRSMDPSLEEAAVMSGATSWTVIRRVTVPLVKPAFLAATLLTAVRAVDSFDIPALVGVPANIWVFSSRIWNEVSRFPVNIGRAGAYATVLLLIAAAGVVLHNWYVRKGGSKRVQTVGGKAYRARTRPIRGTARLAANLFIVFYVVSVIGLPVFALVYSSLTPTTMAPSAEAFSLMSLENYRWALGHPQVATGAWNSLILSVATATTVMILMSIAAWIVVRTNARGRGILDNVAFWPIVYPSLVLGLSILILYLRVPLPIYGTLLILFVAYVTKYLPYGMRFASTSMYQIHREVEEAAGVAGASWWQGFRRVILPLIAPGFIAGWIYIAMIAVRELGSSVLLYSPGSEVLAIAMFRMYFEGRMNEMAALGVVLMIGLTVMAMAAYKLGQRFGVPTQNAAGVK